VNGEVLIVERLGGQTYLYVKIADGDTLVVQTDGDNSSQLRYLLSTLAAL
jgi:multiple sugar transport system ATP-binding protein